MKKKPSRKPRKPKRALEGDPLKPRPEDSPADKKALEDLRKMRDAAERPRDRGLGNTAGRW